VVVGYIPPGRGQPAVTKGNEVLARIADARGALFWDPAAEGWLDGRSDAVGRDGYELTVAGHRLLADEVLEQVRHTGLDDVERGQLPPQ